VSVYVTEKLVRQAKVVGMTPKETAKGRSAKFYRGLDFIWQKLQTLEIRITQDRNHVWLQRFMTAREVVEGLLNTRQ